MITEEKIQDLIDESILSLADDNPRVGAESLVELAQIFAKAGMTKQSFMDIRKYIVEEAIELTDPLFIKEKLELSEKQLQGNRCGTVKRIIIH
jgi:hypothetical protein